MTPFDILKVINEKTKHEYDEVIHDYNPWIINHALSNNINTILFAEEMSRFNHLDKDIQFDFYFLGITKGKRFGKWNKKDTTDEMLINILCESLNCNQVIAKRYLSLLSDKQIRTINIEHGGNDGRNNNRGGDNT